MSLVYFDEIPVNFSLMDVIQGNTNIHVSNPFFSGKGIGAFDEKNWFKKKPDTESEGTYYSAPSIYLRRTTKDEFKKGTCLGLLGNRGSKSLYTFFRPFGKKIEYKSNMKIGYLVKDASWTDKLIILDTRLNMVLEILLICRILAIDLKPYAGLDNNEFFEKFNDEISSKQTKLAKGKVPVVVTPDFIEMWEIPPIYVKDAEEDKLFRVAESVFNEKQDEVIATPKNFEIPSPLSKLITRVSMTGLSAINTKLKPMNTRKLYKDKDGGYSKSQALNLIFKIKMPKSKIPDAYLTKKIVKKAGVRNDIILTNTNVSTLWGGEGKVNTIEGFIIVSLDLNFSLFKIGASYIKWNVAEYNGKNNNGGAIAIPEEEMPDIEDDDDNDDTDLKAIQANNLPDVSEGDDVEM